MKIRPTRAALMLAVAAAICIGLGVLFGRREMFLLSGVCLTSIVTATLYVLLAPLNLSVQRDVSPSVPRVGNNIRSTLTLVNQGRLRTPILYTVDQLGERTGAALHIAPLRNNEQATVSYEIPAEKRGELTIGPLNITITDPFGIIKTKVRAAESLQTLVRPQQSRLASPQPSGGDLSGDLSTAQKLSPSGDEFVRLRPYVVGDELRRVHWPASAKTGDLVVRQTEETRTGFMSVLLDLSADRYSSYGFERAVSTTLSALVAGFDSDNKLQYLTSAKPTSRVDTTAELNSIDLQLALIQTTDTGSITTAFSQLTKRGHPGGTLVLVTGRSDQEIEQLILRAERQFDQVLTVLCDSRDQKPPFWHIRNDGTTDLPLGWASALRGKS